MQIGGKLSVRIPNIDAIISQLASQPETRNQFLYGTTEITGIFGAHKNGFTPTSLSTLMLEHDLKLMKIESITTNYEAQFIKVEKIPPPKKIVYLNQTLGLGGAEIFMADLLSELNDQNFNVICITSHQSFQEILKKQNLNTSLFPLVIDLIGNWKGLIKALYLWPRGIWLYHQAIINNLDADLFLFSGFTEKIFGTWIAKLHSKPVVWIEFGPLESVLNKFFYLPKILYYLVKNIPEKIIVPSTHTAEHLTSKTHVDLSKIQIIPCGRRVNNRDLQSPNRTNRSKLKSNTRTITCISRLEPGKGQDILIRAFAHISSKVDNLKLKIVGEGDFLTTLRQQVQTLKLQDKVEFTGRVKSTWQEIQQADLCVFPSIWALEGFGMVVIEVLAMGKPIVAFNHKPVNEILTDKVTALLANSGDEQNLADNITLLLNNSQLAKKIASNGKYFFQENYKIENIAKKYQQVLTASLRQFEAKNLLKSSYSP